jgi:hypothetical protein
VTTDITTTSTALSAEDLALMAGDAEHAPQFSREELMTPQLRIVQSMSGYLKTGTPNYIREAREGDFIDTLTLTLRPEVDIIVCHYEQTYTEWGPNMGPLVKQWGTDPSGYDRAEGDYGMRKTADGNEIVPAATYYVLLKTDDAGGALPCVVYLTSTQYKKSRKLNSQLAATTTRGPDGALRPAPIFARVFHCTSVRESGDQGDWMGWKIDMGPMTLAVPGGRDLYMMAKAFRESILRNEVRVAPPRDIDEASPSRATTSPAQDDGADIPF